MRWTASWLPFSTFWKGCSVPWWSTAEVEQFVRIDSGSLEERIGILGFIESKILRRSAEKTGELHRWFYDQYTLTDLLSIVGFINIKGYQFNSSGIKGWNKFELDINEKGEEYKKDSLYIEGQKHQIWKTWDIKHN